MIPAVQESLGTFVLCGEAFEEKRSAGEDS